MSHSNEQHRTSARKYIHIFQEWRFRIGSVILCLLFFQSIFSLAALEAAIYRWTTPPVVALPFYPDAIPMAFVISRIIKYYVTIIFIQLSVLGLIANYCYLVSRDSANCSISLNDFFLLSLMPWIRFENLLELMIWWILKRLNSFRWYFVGNSQSSTKLPNFMEKYRAHLFLRHLQTNALVFFFFFGIFTFQPLEILFIIVWYMHETHSNIWFLCEREISDWNLKHFESNAIQIPHDK